ncbi:hypothetical protein NP590_06510 [Methylomonas sp. SURF-2]|uniref:DUF2169 domain-containing protein n=1 Tax=Methylomonas subterranea TaxID=2952225 RepID=A0ABT1TE61_9GAMM|nr:hypothetical protein [Methylomonas sp. SURF-2]MCQ8103751.1 hypothetical protein [Methylomonas sp. SURF-2]
MDYIFPLPLPPRHPPVARDIRIFPGHRYLIDASALAPQEPADAEASLQNGLIGSYTLSTDATHIKAVDLLAGPARGFVWDVDLLPERIRQALQSGADQPRATEFNHLKLLDTRMAAPEVRLSGHRPSLTISPRFELEWHTPAHASQLGIVQLVESTRAAMLANGESVSLLDTESAGNDPVLLLDDPADSTAVKPLCGFQARGRHQRFEFCPAASQGIPDEIDGQAVASLSVLEKYTLYFMQNADPMQPDSYIWVPVHLPIVWGWSIRVQQRYDGVWDVFRKKLIMPTPSTEAPALPRWRGNSLRCRNRVEI